MDEDLDYEKKLEIFCKARGIWNDKKKCPTRFVINKLKTITVTHPDGYTYKQNVHDGFTTKRIQYQTCQYCHKELTGKQKKYCSLRCGDLRGKLKKIRIQLGAEGILIKKDPIGFPQLKNMIVTFRGKNGELIQVNKNAITKKSGKQHNNNLNEFSTGIDN